MQLLRLVVAALLLLYVFASWAGADEPAGMRRLEGKHLTLVTDVAASPEVDVLPGYFDQAFDQWCAYFGLDPAAHADWHVRGYLMRSPERFRAAGLLPDTLPEFANAYSLKDEFWLYDQTSDYYRRHLLLHEGTHAFMGMRLGGTGPIWYAEGVAELLATHRLDGGKLVMNVFPRAADEVPKWGRIELVDRDFAARRARSLAKVFTQGGTLHSGNEDYGWCWAAAAFFDGHPRYRDRFRQLPREAAGPQFADRVRELFAADGDRLNEDWQLFAANLDYGYDFAREEVDRSPGKPLAGKHSLAIAADRGWQSTGIAVAPGETYQLRATGRYRVAEAGETWMSEPGGITLDYQRGLPLGALLGAIRSDDPQSKGASGLVMPFVVGLGRTLAVDRPGTLYLRINDSAGRLNDNSGAAEVEIVRVGGG